MAKSSRPPLKHGDGESTGGSLGGAREVSRCGRLRPSAQPPPRARSSDAKVSGSRVSASAVMDALCSRSVPFRPGPGPGPGPGDGVRAAAAASLRHDLGPLRVLGRGRAVTVLHPVGARAEREAGQHPGVVGRRARRARLLKSFVYLNPAPIETGSVIGVALCSVVQAFGMRPHPGRASKRVFRMRRPPRP